MIEGKLKMEVLGGTAINREAQIQSESTRKRIRLRLDGNLLGNVHRKLPLWRNISHMQQNCGSITPVGASRFQSLRINSMMRKLATGSSIRSSIPATQYESSGLCSAEILKWNFFAGEQTPLHIAVCLGLTPLIEEALLRFKERTNSM